MIEGAVNAALQAVISLTLSGPSGRSVTVEAVVDTGFDRFLTLPPDVVTELDLSFFGSNLVQLADGSDAALDGYAVTVQWDGRPRRVAAYVSEAAPMVGMALLAGHSLYVDVARGGQVVIEGAA